LRSIAIHLGYIPEHLLLLRFVVGPGSALL